MGFRIALSFGLVAVAPLLTGTGCSSTSAGAVAADGSVEAATVDANAPGLVRASDYDQSCTVDTDCVPVSEGNLCDPAASECPNAAISKSADAQYQAAADKALASCHAQASCAFPPGACCVAGNCHIATGQCTVADAAPDVATVDAGPDADACAPPVVCTGACVSGAHNVSTMVNGCLVTRCCVLDDASTD
jgi:hypothetical protein